MIHDFTITDIDAPHARYRVTDATGRHLTYLQWCDDRTGEVVRLVRDERGLFVIDPATMEIVKVAERHPAPLTVSRLRDDEPYLLTGAA